MSFTFPLPLPLPLAIAAVAIPYVLWRVFGNFFIRSPFDNIPGPPSSSWFAGNLLKLVDHDAWSYTDDLIQTYGPVAKLHSLLGARWLHVYDPRALHAIFVKDQEKEIFTRDPLAVTGAGILLGPGLLATAGAAHRKQRRMLQPVFSVAHLRNMAPTFYGIAKKLRTAIESRVRDGPQKLDVVSWMGRTALEIIGQSGLGYSFDPLVANAKDEYTEAVKSFIPTIVEIEFMRVVIPFIGYLGPAWFRRWLLNLIPQKSVQRMKYIVDTMYERSKEIFEAKKALIESGDDAMLHQVGEGRDVMSILLRENMRASEEDKLDDEQLLSQMSTFIMAGMDTTSNAMSRVLHLLALNPGIQEKLRSELANARETYGDEIPFDDLMALPYLDAICRETLRLHAPATLVFRTANVDTVLPLMEPVRGVDGTLTSEIAVPKGSQVVANLRAVNTYKAIWGEDAHEWKPERWLNPLPRSLEEARVPGIYSHLMTFVNGSYSCIGFKFSQLEMKTVLYVLVSSFKFELSDTQIHWNFSGVVYPATSKDSAKPEMWMNVSLAP
ncbi:cytochrome P450 [Ganoderma sinense ZZ0214-1]|uniref:Cytochrome P450 n=1 Tax=Ganoderma sinense ZZ0214-1 TaxID=1077348 RepID=A0A2G8SHR2_9APHY|nr:cytochrome P450 [Ganoderma sinense ZZ0214-1]